MNLPVSRFLLVAFGVALASTCFAQSGSSTSALEPQAASGSQQVSPISLRVLQTWRVKNGDHSIVYNRVEPPAIPAPAPTPQPVLSLTTPSSPVPGKAYQSLLLTATVYDRQLTELRWFDGQRWLRAFTNIDFNQFGAYAQFETGDTSYAFPIFTYNERTLSAPALFDTATLTMLAQARQRLPILSPLTYTRSSYFLVDASFADNPDSIAALNALHAFYDANRARLIQQYQAQLADEVTRTKVSREHPPVEGDTVINFWRKPSSAPLGSGN